MNTGSKHKPHATRQQDGEEVDIGTQTSDTKHVEVNDENNKFTVRGLTVKACFSTPCTSK